MDYEKPLHAQRTPIPGLLLWDLPVYGDNRGWFKENWQREKMIAEGLPDFGPVQNNVSFNDAVGTTRGIHAEPWDKFVSVATGRVFGAWVDLRDGPNFGKTFSAELDPSRAVFVPSGVGNAFQTLEANTAYSYLVNDHYSPDVNYTAVDIGDESLGIEWPIPLPQAELSPKDRSNPPLVDVTPVPPRRILVVGAGGQLGHALHEAYRDATNVEFAHFPEFDLTSTGISSARRWRDYDVIINAAAYTAVDLAETPEGRISAWAVNAKGVTALARIASTYGILLVHVSSDYVFDGKSDTPYTEDDPLCPLGVYGQTKAAGDLVVSTTPRHYIVRTAWLIGNGNNFVRTMHLLAERGANPRVVNDQFGRLTFASDVARGIRHLIDSGAQPGTYNLTCAGPADSWAGIAQNVFTLTGHDQNRVTGVSTSDYFTSASAPVAPRPINSILDLSKIESTGFIPRPMDVALSSYLSTARHD